MAKPNFRFEKRQRELEKQRKKDEKAQRRLARKGTVDDAADGASVEPSVPPADSGAPPDA